MSTITRLDVRPVAPKDRLDTIMGAYDSLVGDETLDLTVDHDPRCMYYTLEALHGPAAFSFEYLETGPEVWRIHVRKRSGDAPSSCGCSAA